MHRRTFLAATAGGLLSGMAGCSELRGLTGPSGTGTNANQPTPTTDEGPIERSFGEAHSAGYHRTVTVRDATVQNQVGYRRYNPSIEEAVGQFIVVQVGLDEASRSRASETGAQPRASRPESRAIRYGRTPPAAHPTPRPPLFEPRLRVHLDGTVHRPSVRRGTHGRAMVAFDVPASSASAGSVSWPEPDPPASWELPTRILDELPRVPSFRRRSISVRGWPWSGEGVALGVTVENTSASTGVYRASLILEEGRPGHDSRYVERAVPPHSQIRIEESYSFTYGQRSEEATIVFDDGDDHHRVTVRREQ